jgi:hypothetical protein
VLQFPTNVYPQNVAFDPTVTDGRNHLSFTFNGDILTTASFNIYNYLTGELAAYSFYATTGRVAWHYNGEQVSFEDGALGDNLSSGNDYVIQMMLTQSKADGSDNIYDMNVVRGKVQENPTTATVIPIEDKIMNIYEWNVSNNVCSPTTLNGYIAAGMIINIGTESRFIESYNRETGAITVSSAFTTTPQQGDSYTIYSNYLVTPQYYFMCRTNPTLTVSSEIQTTAQTPLGVTGTYSQAQNTMLKHYDFTLSWYDQDTQPTSMSWRKIKQSPLIYSQKVGYYFYDWQIGADELVESGTLGTIWYKVDYNVVTQDGVTATVNTIFSVAPDTSEDALDPRSFTLTALDSNKPDYIEFEDNVPHQAVLVKMSYKSLVPNGIIGTLYRQDLETGLVTKLKGYVGGSLVHKYTDYLVPNRGEFKYYYVPRRGATGSPLVNFIQTATISTNFNCWSITALEKQSDYFNTINVSVKECWKFIGETQDTTINQNIDRVTHVGHGKYTAVSSGEPNYASGTLTALLAYISCPNNEFKDTVNMVIAWRKFITSNNMFLLKSPKGDVWIVNVTDIPTTTYQEDNDVKPTTFTFSWSECCSVDDIYITNVFD